MTQSPTWPPPTPAPPPTPGPATIPRPRARVAPAAPALPGGKRPPALGAGVGAVVLITAATVLLSRRALELWSSHRDVILGVAPPKTGKTAYRAGRVIAHPGPVVSTSTKVDGWKHTAADRALGGRPVLVFNPENLGKIASTLGWDPLTGCTGPAVAAARPAAPPRPVGARSRLGGGRLGGGSLIAARVAVLRRRLGVRPAVCVMIGQLVPGSPRRGGLRRWPRRGVRGDAS